MRARGARLGRALLAASAVLVACEPYVQGNGVFVEERRELAPFVGVHVEDGVQVIVTAGAATQSVVVQGDANLLRYVRTVVREDEVPGGEEVKVLHVSVDLDDFDPAIPVKAVVKVTALRSALADERSEVGLEGVAATEMVVSARGHSLFRLAGPGGAALRATLDDAALDARAYPVEDAVVALTNGSRIELNASGVVEGTADGSSTVDNLRGSGSCGGVDGGGLVCCKPALTCPP